MTIDNEPWPTVQADEHAEAAPLLAKTLVSPPSAPRWRSSRFLLAYLTFLGFFCVYALRVNLSVAVVDMEKDFNWSNSQKANVLSAFFYGYIFTQVPGGWLATKYGAKLIFGLGVLVTAILTLITPLVAGRMWLLLAVRVLEGVGEGVTYPSVHALWSRWAPPNERSILATLGYSGAFFGTVASFPLSGVLADSSWGWPAVFYVFGVVGVVWFLLWMAFACSTPEKDRFISAEERAYLLSVIDRDTGKEIPATPWVSIFTSTAVWAIIVMHFANNWMFYVMLTCLPSFFNDVVGFSLSNGALYAAMPYLALGLMNLCMGHLADWLRAPGRLSTGTVRRLLNTIGYIIGPTFLLLAGTVPGGTPSDDPHVALDKSSKWWLCVIYLTIATGCIGMGGSGFNINHLDIAPKYAGVLLGITNGVATIPGFVGPTVAGIITTCGLCDNKGSPYFGEFWEGPSRCPPAKGDVPDSFNHCTQDIARHQWQVVFYIAAGMVYACNMVYLIFARGTVQKWAR